MTYREQGGPRRRTALLLLLAALVAAGIAVAAVLVGRGGEDLPPGAVDLGPCRALLADAAQDCLVRSFTLAVAGRDDPRPSVAAIETAVRSEGGFGLVLSSCHGVMHTVGRTYALDEELALSDLQEVLPRSNEPGCSAGFAHGLVTGVAPRLDVREPRKAGEVCANAGTRYQRYSCVHGLGHAFMRPHGDRLQPALELCRALGEPAPDCAQGAYHDYWFAVVGADDAELPGVAVRDPRVLCAAQPQEFVRPCWYRAFVDDRPAGIVVDSREHFEVLCRDLAGLQRQGCVTAVSVIRPPDPALQLQLCAQLVRAEDAESCVRGTKVQNLLASRRRRSSTSSAAASSSPKRRASRATGGSARRSPSSRTFADSGCPQLESAAAERLCRDGAASMDAALVTFS